MGATATRSVGWSPMARRWHGWGGYHPQQDKACEQGNLLRPLAEFGQPSSLWVYGAATRFFALHLFGNDPGLSIGSFQVPVCLAVVNKGPCARIKL